MSAWVLVHRIDGEGQPPTVGSVARERERREVGASLAALQEPADRLTVMAERAAGVHTVDRVERGGDVREGDPVRRHQDHTSRPGAARIHSCAPQPDVASIPSAMR